MLTADIAAFLASRTASGASPNTIRAYTGDLARLADHLPAHTHDLSPAALDTALTAATADLSTASATRIAASVKSFCRWASDTGRIATNPANAVRTRRAAQDAPVSLNEQEQTALLRAVRQSADKHADRDRIIIEFLLRTGLRVSEVASMNIADVDLDDKHARVRVKGQRTVTVFLVSDLRRLLRPYIARRRRETGSPDAPLFTSQKNTRITTRHIARVLDHWLHVSGIQKHIGPHGLRHTFAMNLCRASRDIRVVSRALNHRSIVTTMRYAAACDETVENAMEAMARA